MPISDMGGELAVIAEHLRTTIRLTLDCLFGVDACRITVATYLQNSAARDW
jgi:hypothetical protein